MFRVFVEKFIVPFLGNVSTQIYQSVDWFAIAHVVVVVADVFIFSFLQILRKYDSQDFVIARIAHV